MRLALQTRFLLVLGLVSLLLLAIVGVVFARQLAFQHEISSITESVSHEMALVATRAQGGAIAARLSGDVSVPLERADWERIDVLVGIAAAQPMVGYASVFDTHGRQLRRWANSGTDQDSPATLDVTVPVVAHGRELGSVHVGMLPQATAAVIASAKADLQGRLARAGERYWNQLLLLLGGGVLIAGLFPIYVQRTLVAPIRLLLANTRRIEHAESEVPTSQASRKDEIGELLTTFDRMNAAATREHQQVKRMESTDPLTGLVSRLAFNDMLAQKLHMARISADKLALLFLDIDGFRLVNDSFGHEAGDRVLQEFALRIKAEVAELVGAQGVVAYFGGDEFLILLQAPDVRQISQQLSQSLVLSLSIPLTLHERPLYLGASIGIALFPDDAVESVGLLKAANIAMYQAKMAEKNCYRFYNLAVDRAADRRLKVQYELRGAWERRELQLVYQPIYRASDLQLMGVEVLLRWEHPVLGEIPPSNFIEVAEQSGLIESIGYEVLLGACVEGASWEQINSRSDLFLSVNVSPRQLRNSGFVEMVDRCLAISGFPASRLHLELTETALITDGMQLETLLERLRRNGIKIWLDDFGTGFSGLNHLRQVPMDGVKIDKSFVADLHRDASDLALTKAIISMAHVRGVDVVAEGVEQAVQHELLRECGCELVQGYWLSAPLSEQDLHTLLAASEMGGHAPARPDQSGRLPVSP